jgi:23S rRNA pseudouridine1911/1915/1917 synthase
MRKQELKKIYWAIVEGKVMPETGTLKHKLAHGSHRATVSKDGKEAILHYKVIDQINTHSVVEIELQTGRYHQIRVQFSAIGHPVVGDTKYGAKTKLAKEAIALHHMKLEFCHPVTKELMVILCPAPKVTIH